MLKIKFVRAALCAALMGTVSSLGAADGGSGYDPTLFGEVTAVIGGAPTALGNFPAAVALLRVSPTNTLFQRQFCAGAAISDEYIVTAAHCMFGNFGMIDPSEVLIAGDFVDLTNDSPAEIPIAQIIVHPGYDNDARFAENDIALMRTAVPHGLPLMQLFNGDARKLTGEQSLVIGWGLTNTNPDVFPSLLNAAVVPITDFATCSNVYERGLGPEHICAGFEQGGVDACQGDSGGPLMIRAANQNIQVGVTSFGNGCALPDAYGVYSNVTQYESWINSNVPPPSTGEVMFDTPAEFRTDAMIAAESGIGSDAETPSPQVSSGGGIIGDVVNSEPVVVVGSGGGGGGSVSNALLMFLLGGVWLRFIRRAKVPSRKVLSVAAVSVVLGGCVTEAPDALSEVSGNTSVTNVRGVSAVKNVDGTQALTVEASEAHKGLAMFDSVALSEKRESVMLGAAERYGVEPVCSGKKVAPRNSRRADYYERCDFTGFEKPFEGGNIVAVTYHFLSSRVVQIDADLAGHAFVLAPLADSLAALLGDSDFTAPELSDEGGDSSADEPALPQAVYHWSNSPDKGFARLQTAARADDVSFKFSLQHSGFADSIAELPAL